MPIVDLNCDMGEGCPNDAELMRYVSSVNIACGFHAGGPTTMRRTVELAIENGVAIGAHPSYPDRENFGRTAMGMSHDEVISLMEIQIGALAAICEELGGSLNHVKPHGALYNFAARDRQTAAAIAEAVRAIDPSLVLYGLAGSISISEAESAGLRTASEAFADRTYRADGSLTPRTEPNALITNTSVAAAQALQMVLICTLRSTEGLIVPIKADTICIHGDGEYAAEFAAAIRETLTENGVEIRKING